MKKILFIILSLSVFNSVFAHNNKRLNSITIEKSINVHAGAEMNFMLWPVGGGSLGPNIGISWEKWNSRNKGLSIGIEGLYSYGYPGGLASKNGSRELSSYSYIAVPILWGFRNRSRTFAFRIGLKPKVSITVPYGDQRYNSGRSITTAVRPEINLPLCFTYFATQNLSLNLNITFPGLFFPMYTPISPSIGVYVSWSFIKDKHKHLNPVI